jgi:hypothetical protein
MTLDIASWAVVPFWFGLACWIVLLGNEDQRAYPHYIQVTEMLITGIGGAFVGFGIIWLTMRVTLKKVSWWLPIATSRPTLAKIIVGLGPASFVFGFLLVKILMALSNVPFG